jgi:guanosine-3',5'-bis(diphosphate) 3'-pyrophosphohydrolase
MAGIKRELEDLSLKVLDPDAYQELSQRIQVRKKERETFLNGVMDGLRDALKAAGLKAEVNGRPKHFHSIYQKIRAGKALEQVYDLFGMRIITHTRNDCYRALGVVHDQFDPVAERFKDYIATPKSNMYQSLHTTVLTIDGEMVEVQIRTWDMHRTAETGVAAHYVYKQGGHVDEELDKRLGGFVAEIAGWQRETDDDEYMDFLRTALHQEEVFVYTPRRELKRLAKGATPLDFAYLIHTEVGQKTVGARVNGELVPLRYELRNGDTVEIITSAQAKPHEDWLKIARTAQARGKIRHWLKAQRLTESVALGREILLRELKKHRRKLPDDTELLDVAQSFGFSEAPILFAKIGEGVLSARNVLHRIYPELVAPRKDSTVDKLRSLASRPVRGIRIQDISSLMIRMAQCCHPVPGDPVIGVITRGRGVSIHRNDCPNVLDGRVEAERLMEVTWDVDKDRLFLVRLSIYGDDRENLLADVAMAISRSGTNIKQGMMDAEDDHAIGDFLVEVKNVAHLGRVMKAIRAVKGVTRVERLQLEGEDPER